MNKRQMRRYAEEHGCIYNATEIQRRMDLLGERVTRFEVIPNTIEGMIIHARTGERIKGFYDRVNNLYIDINFNKLVKVDNKYLTEAEFEAEQQISIFNANVSAQEEADDCFSDEELHRINSIHERYDLMQVLPYGRGDYIYNNLGILKDGEDDSSITMGFELEFNVARGFSEWNTDDRVDFLDMRLGHIEHDASISGFEFISHVFTWNKFKKCKELFKKQLNQFTEEGLVSTDGAGLHIHIGRDAFNDEIALKKFYFLINCRELRSSWERLARRSNDSYYRYSSLEVGNLNHLNNSMSRHERDHGVAVNQQHDNTIEVRIFNSTMSSSVLFNALELMVRLVEFCNSDDNHFSFSKIIANTQGSVFFRYIRTLNANEIDISFINPLTRDRAIELMQEALASGDIERAMQYGTQIQQEGGAR